PPTLSYFHATATTEIYTLSLHDALPIYDELKGVDSVESGYMGGEVDNPTYEQVCDGSTGHAEVVRITFDPHVTTYQDILQVFFVDRKSTRLNSSHVKISYAVFCLKKKNR